MLAAQIKKNIYWVGAVDWNVRDFHGYSTPQGTTYNAYLIKDKKIALFDTVKKPFLSDLLTHIKQVVEPEKIDYLIVNHVEMDHSGALPEVVDIIKPEKIYCSQNGKKAMIAHFHHEDWPYEVVKTGDKISLGEKSVKFIETRMLHWPDSMFSYIPEDKLLISQDAFGQHWATTERYDYEVDLHDLLYQSKKYYANILLPYSNLVQKLLATLSDMNLDIDMIASDHGLVWQKNIDKILAAYDKWSKQIADNKVLVVYDTMWHSTENMARAIVDGLQESDVSAKLLSMDVNHRSDIITELIDAKAVLLGSSTLNNNMLPRMADMLCYMKGLRPLNKIGAAFGSYGWGGEAVKQINATMEEMKFDIIDPGIRIQYVPTQEQLEQCVELGRKVGAAVKA